MGAVLHVPAETYGAQMAKLAMLESGAKQLTALLALATRAAGGELSLHAPDGSEVDLRGFSMTPVDEQTIVLRYVDADALAATGLVDLESFLAGHVHDAEASEVDASEEE